MPTFNLLPRTEKELGSYNFEDEESIDLIIQYHESTDGKYLASETIMVVEYLSRALGLDYIDRVKKLISEQEPSAFEHDRNCFTCEQLQEVIDIFSAAWNKYGEICNGTRTRIKADYMEYFMKINSQYDLEMEARGFSEKLMSYQLSLGLTLQFLKGAQALGREVSYN